MSVLHCNVDLLLNSQYEETAVWMQPKGLRATQGHLLLKYRGYLIGLVKGHFGGRRETGAHRERKVS